MELAIAIALLAAVALLILLAVQQQMRALSVEQAKSNAATVFRAALLHLRADCWDVMAAGDANSTYKLFMQPAQTDPAALTVLSSTKWPSQNRPRYPEIFGERIGGGLDWISAAGYRGDPRDALEFLDLAGGGAVARPSRMEDFGASGQVGPYAFMLGVPDGGAMPDLTLEMALFIPDPELDEEITGTDSGESFADLAGFSNQALIDTFGADEVKDQNVVSVASTRTKVGRRLVWLSTVRAVPDADALAAAGARSLYMADSGGRSQACLF